MLNEIIPISPLDDILTYSVPSCILFKKLPMVQAIRDSFQNVQKKDVLLKLTVALAVNVIGQNTVFARNIVVGKDAA